MEEIIKQGLAQKAATEERDRVVGQYIKLLNSGVKRTPKIFRNEPVYLCRDRPAMEGNGILQELQIGMVARDVQIDLPRRPNDDGEFQSDESAYELQAYSPPNDPYLSDGSTSYYSVVQPVNVENIEKAREVLLQEVTELWKQGANVICVNEIGYPAFRMAEHGKNSQELKEIQDKNHRLKKGDEIFRLQLQALANGQILDADGNVVEEKQRAIIVAGSYHDPQEMTNVAVIFFPQYDQCTQSSPVLHRKQTTAKSPRIGEVVRTPADPFFPLYTTHLGVMSVLICLDAYDLNMYMRQLHLAQESPKECPSIILVPSHSPTSLANACKDLSEAARALVIHVNPIVHKAKTSVYFCGSCLFEGDTIGRHLMDKIEAPERLNDKRHELLIERQNHIVISGTRF